MNEAAQKLLEIGNVKNRNEEEDKKNSVVDERTKLLKKARGMSAFEPHAIGRRRVLEALRSDDAGKVISKDVVGVLPMLIRPADQVMVVLTGKFARKKRNSG